MKLLITIIIFSVSSSCFGQTASSRPLSAVMPDSLLQMRRQAPGSPENLPGTKSLPAVEAETKKASNRSIPQKELPGNAAVNVDSIVNRSRRFNH